MEISERQKAILCQIIEEYAETASPVGSVTLAKLFDVSPATIRAEMARLDALGLTAQPHTSAGRVPTDAGYRFYVNNLDGLFEDTAWDISSDISVMKTMMAQEGLTENNDFKKPQE